MSNYEENPDVANRGGPYGSESAGQPYPSHISQGDCNCSHAECLSLGGPCRMKQDRSRPQAGGDPPSIGDDQPSTGRGYEPTGESYVSGAGDPAGAKPTGVYGDDNTTGTVGQPQGGYDDPALGEQHGRTKPTMGQKIKGATDEAVGKLTGNPGKVERGQEERTGEYGTLPGHNRP